MNALDFVEQAYEVGIWVTNEAQMCIPDSDFNVVSQDLKTVALEVYQNRPLQSPL